MRPTAHLCLFLMLLLFALPCLSACGEECPGGSQGGSCDLSNTSVDPTIEARKLELVEGCDYLPATVCTGDPGFTCSQGGGGSHRHAYAVIGSQQAWDKLAAGWADPAGCTPSHVPTDWQETFVVLATMNATEATAATVNYTSHRRANGGPHFVVDFAITAQPGGGSAQSASLGLIVKNEDQPLVCLKVASTCK